MPLSPDQEQLITKHGNREISEQERGKLGDLCGKQVLQWVFEQFPSGEPLTYQEDDPSWHNPAKDTIYWRLTGSQSKKAVSVRVFKYEYSYEDNRRCNYWCLQINTHEPEGTTGSRSYDFSYLNEQGRPADHLTLKIKSHPDEEALTYAGKLVTGDNQKGTQYKLVPQDDGTVAISLYVDQECRNLANKELALNSLTAIYQPQEGIVVVNGLKKTTDKPTPYAGDFTLKLPFPVSYLGRFFD